LRKNVESAGLLFLEPGKFAATAVLQIG